MKKLFLLSLLLYVSFSFGQTKKKEIVSDSTLVEHNIPIVKEIYDKGMTIHSESPSQEAVVNDVITIYNPTEVEVKPEFNGGMENFYAFVSKNYKMPDEEGLRGKVFLTFIVESDGSLTDIKVRRDIGFGTGNEAVRVLKLSQKWNPAELNGKKVRCSYSLSIPVST